MSFIHAVIGQRGLCAVIFNKKNTFAVEVTACSASQA